MTSNESLLQETSGKNIRFVNVLPNELLEILEQEGYGKLLVIGGGTLNASFLKEGLIDELILSVHPIILGKGIKLFENYECNVQLEEIGVKELDEGLVQIRYKVVK